MTSCTAQYTDVTTRITDSECHALCLKPPTARFMRGTVCAAVCSDEYVEQLCYRAGQQLAVDADICCCER